eukprot:TRINITY_DN1508_c0_g1_i1.p1 TRINITY_DN1508_c0_g1~~TRINITY_DN1508_c0_g1_i1.p1  ORF type:complete len:520 (+),score=229.00 TRINITY_DN1508_c0_g1_i1:69-1628(+)
MKTFTMAEVAKHNTEGDLWVAIDGDVFDLTKFLKFHPGGAASVLPYAGKDATEQFYGLHRVEVLKKYMKLRVGKLEGAGQSCVDVYDPVAVSQVPYSEVSALQGIPSPYYNESHLACRKAVAEFREKYLKPIAEQHEKSGKHPTDETFRQLGKHGILLARLGPGPWVKECIEEMGVSLPGGVKPEEFDYFHELMVHDQIIRTNTASYCAGLGDGFVIGCPTVIHFAKPTLRKAILPSLIKGEKKISLAISEPDAGSDVANITTTATLSPCKKFYLVSGTKKWITNGHFSDYFATAVRTGGKGMFGISMLLIERSEGVTTTPIPTSYSACAGTSLVEFKNVKVPVENLLGKRNGGFQCIMQNFNHERWMICAQVVSSMRVAVDETFKWATQRKVFGRRLIDQPVIRNKLARMVASMEGVAGWLDQITYALNKLSWKDSMARLAGPLALLKYQITRAALQVADDAAQIFGGRAITRTGPGKHVESFFRTVKYGAILGGSEEIMADLGIRQAMKNFPKQARL